MTYFADRRLNTTGTIPLDELTGNATTPLADQPVNLDFFYDSGEPDYYASANGNGATVTSGAQIVVRGSTTSARPVRSAGRLRRAR